MTKQIATFIASAAFALVAAGATWRFGSYGLMAAGVVALAALFVFDIKE